MMEEKKKHVNFYDYFLPFSDSSSDEEAPGPPPEVESRQEPEIQEGPIDQTSDDEKDFVDSPAKAVKRRRQVATASRGRQKLVTSSTSDNEKDSFADSPAKAVKRRRQLRQVSQASHGKENPGTSKSRVLRGSALAKAVLNPTKETVETWFSDESCLNEEEEVKTPPTLLPPRSYGTRKKNIDSLLYKEQPQPPVPQENVIRRRRRKFTYDEMKMLVDGYNKYENFHNKWALILSHYEFNKELTNVQLKDKWRNMLNFNAVHHIDGKWVLQI